MSSAFLHTIPQYICDPKNAVIVEKGLPYVCNSQKKYGTFFQLTGSNTISK
jgi:hypothetical protein